MYALCEYCIKVLYVAVSNMFKKKNNMLKWTYFAQLRNLECTSSPKRGQELAKLDPKRRYAYMRVCMYVNQRCFILL